VRKTPELDEARAQVRRQALIGSVVAGVNWLVFYAMAIDQRTWGPTWPLVFAVVGLGGFGWALIHWIALWRNR
jgi:hypothetical protein